MTRSPRTILQWIAASLVAVFLLFEVISVAWEHAAEMRDDPIAAMAVRPRTPSAAAAAALDTLQQGKFAEADALARRALGASPLDQDPLATLALAHARRGDGPGADRLIALAAEGGWRNLAVQSWMIQAALLQKNFPVAVYRADALLREGEDSDKFIALLRALTADAGARSALIDSLGQNPAWRSQFLTDLRTLTPAQYDAHEQVLVGLRAGGGGATAGEVNAFVSLLLAKGEPERALIAWRRITGRAGDHELLQDPYITQPVDASDSASPFSWVIAPTDGLNVTRLSDGSAGGVRLSFDGTGSAKALEQSLVLAPGYYRIEAHGHVEQDGSPSSLRWRLSCLGGGDLFANEATRVQNNRSDIITGGTVTVPGEKCPAQQLAIWLDSPRPDSSALILTRVSLRREAEAR